MLGYKFPNTNQSHPTINYHNIDTHHSLHTRLSPHPLPPHLHKNHYHLPKYSRTPLLLSIYTNRIHRWLVHWPLITSIPNSSSTLYNISPQGGGKRYCCRHKELRIFTIMDISPHHYPNRTRSTLSSILWYQRVNKQQWFILFSYVRKKKKVRLK